MGILIWNDLEKLLSESKEKCLVTLMHANNEIGNILDINAVGNLCKKYNAIFHSDTVQTVGIFLLIFEIHLFILLPAPHINFTGQKVWVFYTSMRM